MPWVWFCQNLSLFLELYLVGSLCSLIPTSSMRNRVNWLSQEPFYVLLYCPAKRRGWKEHTYSKNFYERNDNSGITVCSDAAWLSSIILLYCCSYVNAIVGGKAVYSSGWTKLKAEFKDLFLCRIECMTFVDQDKHNNTIWLKETAVLSSADGTINDDIMLVRTLYYCT